jgi:hypothetical protein
LVKKTEGILGVKRRHLHENRFLILAFENKIHFKQFYNFGANMNYLQIIKIGKPNVNKQAMQNGNEDLLTSNGHS